MSWVKQLKNLTGSLIKERFPELVKKRLIILSFPIGPYWGGSLWPLPFFGLIIISPKARKIETAALTALLAHELSHQVIYRRDNWLKYITRTPLIYIFLKKLIKHEEQAVDRLVMSRGFGRNLYALSEILSRDQGHERIKKHYFTAAEIKDYCLRYRLKF